MAIPKFLLSKLPQGHCNAELPLDWRTLWTRLAIIAQRKIYGGSRGKLGTAYARESHVLDMDASIDLIASAIRDGRPFMAGKIGTGDSETIQRFIDIHAPGGKLRKSIRMLAGTSGPFWWDNWIRSGICVCAGVFPPTDESIEDFCRIFIPHCAEFDAIPGWLEGEKRLYGMLCPKATVIKLEALAPFAHPRSWSGALEGKRVLVIHQYVETIKSQYAKHVEFHNGQGPLPDFDLLQYRPVNSIGGKNENFPNWSAALEKMWADISTMEFDVALLGCGVYGVPLCARIKRMGKTAILTGGATQILFGIKGKRWDRLGIYNENWVRPKPEDIPERMGQIENGCFL